MKPLSIKKDLIRESIAKSQITQKVVENQNVSNINDIQQLEHLLEIIDNEIYNLTEQKKIITERINIVTTGHSDNDDDLQLIIKVSDYGNGTFKNIKYTETQIGNKKQIIIFKRDVKNIDSSPDFKQKRFNLHMLCGNISAVYTIKYYVDNIDKESNTVICDHSISI